MNEFKIGLLPKWVLTSPHPGFYDSESMSAIQMVAKVYAKMNELVEAYNEYVERVNTRVEEFITSQEKDFELFRVELRQEFQDFIDVVELKIGNQDQIINEFVTNMTNAFNEFESDLNGKFLQLANQQRLKLEEMEEEFDQTINEMNNEFGAKLDEYNNRVDDAITGYDQQIQNAINSYTTSFNQKITEFTNTFNQALAGYQSQVDGVIQGLYEDIDSYLEEKASELGVQADWNELNETSKAFIKNRTHYELYSEFTECFNTVITRDYDAGNSGSFNYDDRIIFRLEVKSVINNVYTLLIDEYIRFNKPTDINEKPVIFSREIDNILIEVYLSFYNGKWRYSYRFTNVTYSLTVRGGSYNLVTKTLNPFFLAPNAEHGRILYAGANNTMEWKEGVFIYSPNGTQYKLVVSDDGSLSTEALTE